MDLDPEQYENVSFQETSQPKSPADIGPLLSEKQQTELLYTIKMTAGEDKFSQNENLLDLTCQQTNPRTSRSMDFRDFMEDRVVLISGPVTIQEGYLISYKLYKVKTRKKHEEEFDTIVERRFSDFEYLHNSLIQNYGGYLVPRLPEKSIWTSLNMETTEYVKNRKYRLQKYLEKLLIHRKLKNTQQLVLFLVDPDNNFSEKKGQHVSNASIEDSFYKFTTGALETTSNLLTKYINVSPLASLSSSAFGLSSEIKQKYKLKSTKEDQQILHYEIIVNGLTEVVRQLKMIVEDTCQEGYSVDQFARICNDLLGEDTKKNESRQFGIQQKGTKSKGIENSNMYDRFSQQIQVGEEEVNEYSHLLESYENLFEVIECCKQAIQRRQKLGDYLCVLREKEQELMKRSKGNPRNINLDILRSKIVQSSRKYEQFTEGLLEQLDMQVMMSKSMIGLFVKELVEVRATLYAQGGSD